MHSLSDLHLKVFQYGFNYSQDGPGNRLVFHLQGCNMRCPWCANPESFTMQGALMIDPDYLFDNLCPHGAIKDKKRDPKICETCIDFACIQEENRNKGITWSCKSYSIDEIVKIANSVKSSFYDGGGVTFSGGEATMQYKALKQTMISLKNLDINLALETNGTSPKLSDLFNLIDHLIIDYKIPFATKHKKILHYDNIQLKENLVLAIKQHPDVLIRTPLIHNVNDSIDDLNEFIKFYKSIGATTQDTLKFEFLEYHDYGKNKWEYLGLEYLMPDNSEVSKQTVDMFINGFRKAGLNVVFT